MSDAGQQKQQQLISCRVCGSTNKLRRCSKCKDAFYCSQTHQQSDWRSHRIECRKLSNNNSSSILLETQQSEQNRTINVRPSNSNNSTENTSTNESDVKKCIDINPCSSSTTTTTTTTTTCSSSSLNIEKKQSLPIVDDTESKTEETLPNRPQHLSKIEKTTEDERENQHQFRNLAENSMRISNDNILSPNMVPSDLGHEDLCKHVINDLNMYGLSVIDDFLGRHKGLEILNEVHHMYTAGVFKNGQLVSNVVDEQDLRTIRGDKITWVKGTESGCLNIGHLINQVDNVVISANKMKNNGTLGNYKIKERTKAMVACYPGSGAHYVMHVDNPNKDGRIITAIYYLNLNWDTKRSGGVLRIFPENADTVADIEPKFDRIIFFWSDRRNPHEVQPSHRTRYAITVWYFDADERESALNRYRQVKKKVS